MKFIAALVSMAVAAQAALPIYGKPKMHKVSNIKADSKLGGEILSKARKLEQDDGEVDFTWVAGYSLKFQGCHHISQWNEEADGEEDVKIQTKRLIRFRLCPSDYCTGSDAGGCESGYGDYIIDMNTYLEAYFQAVENNQQYMCEYMEKMVCQCNDDDQDDNFDEDQCMWDCYASSGMAEICMDKNPYEDDEQEQGEQFEVREYVECGEAKFENDNNGRKLEEEEVQYFLGPYCAEQGGSIYLGLFTDDACSVFADEDGGATTYETLAGESLPYASSSIVGMECISCKEPEEVDENNDGNDAEDEDQVVEMCEEIYQTAGKCEYNLGIDDANTAACTYMEGIKIVRQNGTVELQSSKSNKTASVFIGIFVVAFVLLAAYVYYLHTKLQRASINLSE